MISSFVGAFLGALLGVYTAHKYLPKIIPRVGKEAVGTAPIANTTYNSIKSPSGDTEVIIPNQFTAAMQSGQDIDLENMLIDDTKA